MFREHSGRSRRLTDREQIGKKKGRVERPVLSWCGMLPPMTSTGWYNNQAAMMEAVTRMEAAGWLVKQIVLVRGIRGIRSVGQEEEFDMVIVFEKP